MEYGMDYSFIEYVVGPADYLVGEIKPTAIYELADGRRLRLYFQEFSDENLENVELWQNMQLPMK